MRNKAQATVKAAKAQITRDTKNNPDPMATAARGSLADRHVGSHTPDSLYGDGGGDEDAETTE